MCWYRTSWKPWSLIMSMCLEPFETFWNLPELTRTGRSYLKSWKYISAFPTYCIFFHCVVGFNKLCGNQQELAQGTKSLRWNTDCLSVCPKVGQTGQFQTIPQFYRQVHLKIFLVCRNNISNHHAFHISGPFNVDGFWNTFWNNIWWPICLFF